MSTNNCVSIYILTALACNRYYPGVGVEGWEGGSQRGEGSEYEELGIKKSGQETGLSGPRPSAQNPGLAVFPQAHALPATTESTF